MIIAHKYDHLLIDEINEKFGYASNTWLADSLRLLNKPQLAILNLIDGKTTLDEIASKLHLDPFVVTQFANSLADRNIIHFGVPKNLENEHISPKSLTLWIHTTNKCNLGCNYCYISTLQTTGGMSDQVRKQLINRLLVTQANHKLERIHLKLAGGEPLTQYKIWNDFILQATKAFESRNCELKFSFLTNLTILNQEIVSFARANDIQFGVSLDGYGSFHDNTRQFKNGKSSFNQVDRNIRWLVKEKIKVSVSSVITQHNMAGLLPLTNYLIEKKIHFRYSVVRGQFIDRNLLAKYFDQVYSVMEAAVEKGWPASKYFRLNDLKISELGTQTCSSGESGAAIYVNGDVHYCHVQFGTGLGKTGDIFATDLDLMDLIKIGAYNEGYKSEDCMTCHFRHMCTSGCPMYRENGKDPNCGIYHQFIPKLLRLKAKERYYILTQYKNA
ncbi:radical SAM protein [Pedobacter sp. JY14-1]|uniref:radical SAM/SPASM domain-containing protein n=1 Tax=Pedobacter sp. JY14-1 TaxID=3034151 RepID=UPI0023E0FCD8|nr:radical SAM protein [Pedobacter sp. JY14-1]